MNKYAARGLTEAAVEGRRILVITDGRRATSEAVRELNDHRPYGSVLCWGGGRDRIIYPDGGMVIIRSWRSAGYRGISVDDVYLDTGVENQIPDDVTAALIACTATSKDGGLVFA